MALPLLSRHEVPMKSLHTSSLFGRRRAALTLIEVVVSAALLSLMMLGLMALNSTCRAFAKAQRETALASYTVEHAIEDLRARNWGQISNANSVKTWVQNLSCDGLSNLRRPRVKVTVAPYPPLTPEPVPIVVSREADGVCTVLSQPPSGFSLRSLCAVRVDFELTWNSSNGNRERTRSISSVVSLSGLLK
jgi:hypothetical protein